MKKTKNKVNEIKRRMEKLLMEMGILADEYNNLNLQLKKLTSEWSIERAHDEYITQTKFNYTQNNYSILSLKIASFLKERGIPTKAKMIHDHLVNQEHVSITYSNLQNNYLQKMHQDANVNIERVYRGFWQYQKKIGNNFKA
ncbi:hypothetical protein BH739_01250 [Enterococcus casseliflavus]|nr:hypothetical protein BH739_01250 [Enterococcus casseliflavus]